MQGKYLLLFYALTQLSAALSDTYGVVDSILLDNFLSSGFVLLGLGALSSRAYGSDHGFSGGLYHVEMSKWYREGDDYNWKGMFRMSVGDFKHLVDELKPSLKSRRGPKARVKKIVCVTLKYLAHGDTFKQLQYDFGIGQSTAHKYVRQGTKALSGIYKKHVYFPKTIEECDEIADGFRQCRGLPGVVGCIDGSHIRIPEVFEGTCPRALDWFNRKKYYSMVILATCDHRLCFTDVTIGWPGSVHDARILTNSPCRLLGRPPTSRPNPR